MEVRRRVDRRAAARRRRLGRCAGSSPASTGSSLTTAGAVPSSSPPLTAAATAATAAAAAATATAAAAAAALVLLSLSLLLLLLLLPFRFVAALARPAALAAVLLLGVQNEMESVAGSVQVCGVKAEGWRDPAPANAPTGITRDATRLAPLHPICFEVDSTSAPIAELAVSEYSQ